MMVLPMVTMLNNRKAPPHTTKLLNFLLLAAHTTLFPSSYPNGGSHQRDKMKSYLFTGIDFSPGAQKGLSLLSFLA
jgi:hypothetical protein